MDAALGQPRADIRSAGDRRGAAQNETDYGSCPGIAEGAGKFCQMPAGDMAGLVGDNAGELFGALGSQE